jgi:hypothetical protein
LTALGRQTAVEAADRYRPLQDVASLSAVKSER